MSKRPRGRAAPPQLPTSSHSHAHGGSHGHSHRTGAETLYWKEAKPLTATVIGFFFFAIILNLVKSPRASDQADDSWRRPLVDDFYYNAKGFDRERMWLGPFVNTKNVKFEEEKTYSNRRTLAIVAPLPADRRGVSRVLSAWESWDTLCDSSLPKKMSVKLIVHAESETTRAERALLVQAFEKARWKKCFDGDLIIRDGAIEPFERKSSDLARCALFYATVQAASASGLDHFFRWDVNLIQLKPYWLDHLSKEALNNENCASFLVKKSREQTTGLYCSAAEHKSDDELVESESLVDLFEKVRALYNGHGCGNSDRDHVGVSQALEDYLSDESASDEVFKRNSRSRVTYLTDDFLREIGGNKDDAFLEARKSSDAKLSAKTLVAKSLDFSSYEMGMLIQEDDEIFDKFFDDVDRATSLVCLNWLRLHGFGPEYLHTVSDNTIRACGRRLCVDRGYDNVVKQASPIETDRIVRGLCANAIESQNVVDALDENSVYVMSTDMDDSSIRCSKTLFETELSAIVRVEIPPVDRKCSKKNDGCLCAKRLRVLNNDSKRGFSLDTTCPPKMKHDFYEAYVNDPEMRRVDLVVCSYPAANCELYMALKRPLAVYITTRLEFGRFDDSIDWRAPLLHAASPERWKEWVYNLRKIAAHPLNSVLASSAYDVKYAKKFAGVDAVYVPVWCGDDDDDDGESPPAYDPSLAKPFLIAPHVDLLESAKSWGDSAPDDGGRLNAWKHPILAELSELSQDIVDIVRISDVYSSIDHNVLRGNHPGVVYLPTKVSSTEWARLYRMNVPLFVPSLDLLMTWIQKYDIMWRRVHGHPQAFGSENGGGDPNSASASRDELSEWIALSDFYDQQVFPHVVRFDSLEELVALARSVDLKSISSKMREHNVEEKIRIKKVWKKVFQKATPKGSGNNPLPDALHDFRASLRSHYGIPLGPRPIEHPLCRKYFKSKHGKKILLNSPRHPLVPSDLVPFTPPTVENCSPDVSPGDDSCDAYCPGHHTTYRSDLRGCVTRSVELARLGSGGCTLLTNDACADPLIHAECLDECETKWPRLYEKLKWSTSIIAGLCLFGLGAVLALLFARKHWVDPLLSKYEGEHME